MATLLAAGTPQAKSQATAALSQALQKLDTRRAAVYKVVNAAIKALAMNAAPPEAARLT